MQVQSLILPHSMPTLASSTGLFVIRVCLRVFGRSVNRVQLRIIGKQGLRRLPSFKNLTWGLSVSTGRIPVLRT